MAYSTQRAVSDGTLQTILLSINYLDRTDLQVLLNGTVTTAWSWIDDQHIKMTSVVPAGIEVKIKRTTNLEGIRHAFSLGAAFIEQNLDEDFTQILYIAQEALEGSSLSEMYNNLDMHGYQLKNLGNATAAGDAVPYAQLQSMSTGAYASAQAAAASQVAANTSAINAANSATAAAASATAADTSRIQAWTSESNALSSKNAAAASATAASNSATQAGTYATNASASASAAATSAANAQAAEAVAIAGQMAIVMAIALG